MTSAGRRGAAWLPACAALAVSACGPPRSGAGDAAVDAAAPVATCGAADPAASVTVAGTYRYDSDSYALSGTIRFIQAERRVRVTETTYDEADDRSLMGEAELAGNRLDITLVPVNGDADYAAEVGFLFDATGAAFCVTGFSDSNGDYGGAASYHGQRM